MTFTIYTLKVKDLSNKEMSFMNKQRIKEFGKGEKHQN